MSSIGNKRQVIELTGEQLVQLIMKEHGLTSISSIDIDIKAPFGQLNNMKLTLKYVNNEESSK